MEVLTFASRQWDGIQLNSRVGRHQEESRPRQLSVLRDAIMPALAQLEDRPSFRDLARFPLTLLEPGSATFGAIERLQATLASAANQLLDFWQTWNAEFGAPIVPQNESLGEGLSATRDGSSSTPLAITTSIRESLSVANIRIESALGKAGETRLHLEDYFFPTVGTFLQVVGGQSIQRGEFVVRYNPELSDFGNCAARCMLVRAGIPLLVLQEVSGLVRRHRIHSESRFGEPWRPTLETAQSQLDELRGLVLTNPEARLAESAIVLLQVYFAFAQPRPNLAWLGLPGLDFEFAAARLRASFARPQSDDAHDRISLALQTLSDHYRQFPAELNEKENAIQRGGLVLDLGSNEIYWRGTLASQNMNRKPAVWRLITELARRGNITAVDFYENPEISRSAFPTLVGRARNVLPSELASLIRSAGQERYHLDLPVREIVLLEPARAADV